MPPLETLEAVLARNKPGWLEEATRGPLHAAFSSASRSLGKATITLTDDEARALAPLGLPQAAVERWSLDELGRIALFLRSCAPVSAVEQCYFRGDNRERQAVLKALPLLTEPARFVALAVEACRTSVEDVFRAIACGNPFPARHFAEPSFNQMVLKALFIGAAVSEIVGLEGRVTPELLRMADDYAAERRAAGRSVPADIGVLHAMKARGAR